MKPFGHLILSVVRAREKPKMHRFRDSIARLQDGLCSQPQAHGSNVPDRPRHRVGAAEMEADLGEAQTEAAPPGGQCVQPKNMGLVGVTRPYASSGPPRTQPRQFGAGEPHKRGEWRNITMPFGSNSAGVVW